MKKNLGLNIIKRQEQNSNLAYIILNEIFASILIYVIAVVVSLIFDRAILVAFYKIIGKIYEGLSLSSWKYASQISNLTIFRYFSPVQHFSFARIYFFSIWVFVFLLMLRWGKNKIIKYRYIFALLVFVLLVLGKFTGSSLGFYDGMLYDNTENYISSTLLGTPQGLRGDEWATEKPYYFAQESASYAYYNSNLMLDGCDMVVSAFAPIKNILIISRPDLIGFLFLPRDYAFSFYWNLRIILLFMASFELVYTLTKKAKYGVIWALIICFSTPIQWWLSQVFMIVIWSGEYFIVLADKLLQSKERIKKVSYCILASWCAVIYLLTMYPAAQVPLGYIFAVLLFYVFYKNIKENCSIKNNIIYGLIIIVVLIVFGLYYVHMSGNALKTMLNTYYPGKTREWTKLNWDYELLKFVNPFMWCKYLNSVNNCEASQFYSFGIFVVIGAVIDNWRKLKYRKKISLSSGLLIISSLLWIVAYLPEMKIVNKITLLSFSYPARILLAVGFGLSLAMILTLSEKEQKDVEYKTKKYNRIIAGSIFAVFIVAAIKSDLLLAYFESRKIEVIAIIAIGILYTYMGYLFLEGGKKCTKKFYIMLLFISIISTIFVNPITYGTDSMFEKNEMKEVRELSRENEGRWMVSGNATIANLVTAQGVKRTSGTYYYPDKKMMEIIDPDDKYENMWNQYAHIDMRLTDGKNYITQYDEEQGAELGGTDRIVYINLDTAKKIGIKYIMSKYDIPRVYIESGCVEQVYYSEIDGWGIYEVK